MTTTALREKFMDTQTATHLTTERLEFLARLPLLLNSSLEVQKVIEVAIRHIKQILQAEAATVFFVDRASGELTFWALEGGEAKQLVGRKLPSGKGIVGWVITNRLSALVPDAPSDPRFFSAVDREAGFQTRDMICVPLAARGELQIGAIQVLNSKTTPFSEEDLAFVEHFAHQAALAIANSQLYQSLREQHHKLETINRRKEEMISVIAHEFRTPLCIIQSAAELISGGLVNENTVSSVMTALNQGTRRLTKLMSEVRNLTIAQAGELEVHRAPVSIVELLTQLQGMFTSVAAERQLNFQITNQAGECSIEADRALLTIALQNLTSNAIRFTPNGGTVSIGAKKALGAVEFTVTDTGIGIDPKEIPLIFEKFYEVANASEHKSGDFGFKSCGLGLGLATTSAILRAHGASLSVESTLGKGSTFRFSLPVVGS